MLRGAAILGGVALLDELHFFIYVLGVLLLVLAYRILRGVEENVDPDQNFIVRLVRRFCRSPATSTASTGSSRRDGHRYATPLFVCLAAIVAADIAFAVDSIPAAFAITRDSVLIWMANIFALLGLRALFVLVEGLIRRFRYLDETIAIVLALVAVKLLLEDLYKVGPVLTLVVVFVAFTIGIVASLIADRRDPDAEAKRDERRVVAESGVRRPPADRPTSRPDSASRLVLERARASRLALVRPRRRRSPTRECRRARIATGDLEEPERSSALSDHRDLDPRRGLADVDVRDRARVDVVDRRRDLRLGLK